MKPVHLILFFALGATLLPGFAQTISPELLNVVNRLPSGQRNMVINEYERFRSGRGMRAPFQSNAQQRLLPPGSKESPDSDDEVPQGVSLVNPNQGRLELLMQLETMILEDIDFNDETISELEKAKNPESKGRMITLLDRKHDLQNTLEGIMELQLSVIIEETSQASPDQEPELMPFGYDAFDKLSVLESGYHPALQIPRFYSIPSDYEVGPGDFLEIQLFGQQDAQHSVVIGSNGILQFPRIGPINVFEKGSSFQSLKTLIKEKVSEQFGAGVRVSIALSEPRQIKVFLAGEFRKPGQRLVTAGSSLFSLLLESGGFKEIASLRSLTLKRSGSEDLKFDLYDLLLKGLRAESTLKEGDVIFLPSVRNRVWVGGNVLRPAIYEISSNDTLSDIIELAGGFAHRAMSSLITMERVGGDGVGIEFKTLDIAKDGSFGLQNGDRLKVRAVSENKRTAVLVQGEAEHPGPYEWSEGLRISGVLKSLSFLKEDADLNYGLIRRQSLTGSISFLAFSPYDVFAAPGSVKDLNLLKRDELILVSRSDSSKRERAIRPLLEELRYEGKPGYGIPTVRILGMVHFPGEYPYTPGMTVRDLVVAGGGMTGSAYTLSAELSRQTVDLNSSTPMARINHVNLPSLLDEQTLSTKLRIKDILSVKPIPSWSEKNTIEILGEVQFPGVYTFQKNESLKSVFKRAGGFTEAAFLEGAVFTRVNLVEREDEQKERLIAQLEKDLANISLAAGTEQTAAKAKSVADGLLARLQNSKSLGRLVIDLKDQVAEKSGNSIIVRNGDKLFVPSKPFEVSVVGEIQFPTSHLYRDNLSLKDYIQRSGGFTANADESRVFAVKANGAVLTKANSGWFTTINTRQNLEAGDVIVVPINLDKGRWLETLTSGTQVIYQLAVAAAAVNSF